MLKINCTKADTEIGTCLIDGITLQNAVDLLIQERNAPEEFLQHLLPIQLVSLSQVIEALICYDKILTTSSHSETWLNHPVLKGAMDDGIIIFPKISSEVDNQLESHTGRKMIKLARSSVFQYFVDELAENSLEGIVHKIARHYHGIDNTVYRYYEGDKISNIEEILTQASSEWMERPGGAMYHPAVLFGTGAFYYRALSSFMQVPYSPFCLRAPYCIYDDALYGKSPRVGATLAMKIIRDEAVGALQSATGEANLNMIELNLPSLFAFILRRATDRSDVLGCAMRSRETREVRGFRCDMAMLTKAIITGDIPETTRITGLIRESTNDIFQTGNVKLEKKIKIGFARFEVELPMAMTHRMSKVFRKTRRATFYNLLMAEVPTIWRLSNELRRLFDLEIDSMNSYWRYEKNRYI